MKIRIILPILCVFYALTVQAYAQTNFDVLVCANASYTNATIVRATPAYVVVDFDGGIAKVCLTNLPELLQEKYHYDPAAAEKALAAETAREKSARDQVVAQQLAQQKYLASLAGPVETITIQSITDEHLVGSLTCETSSGTILISGLPDSVMKYIRQKDWTANEIDRLQNEKITATSTVNDPNDPDPGFTAQMNAQAALDDAIADKRERIADLKEKLEALNDTPEKADARAYPTGQSYGGMAIWKCSR
jgi:hypothetical protein